MDCPTPATNFDIIDETLADAAAIEALHRTVFGDALYQRAAHVVRQGAGPDPRFCFVSYFGEGHGGASALAGSVRLTRVRVGDGQGFLLGPLAVLSSIQGLGFGRRLVRHALRAVMQFDPLPVFLVGDLPYYGPLGFQRAPEGVLMPGPVNYERVLVAWPEPSPDPVQYDGVMQGISAS